MELSWKQVATIACITIGTGCILGWSWKRYNSKTDNSTDAPIKSSIRRKKKVGTSTSTSSKPTVQGEIKKEDKAKEQQSSSSSLSHSSSFNDAEDVKLTPVAISESAKESTSSSTQDDMATMMKLCDLPVEQIVRLAPEKIQKVFYALLMKGEVVLKQNPSALDVAAESFSKAVQMSPNPMEVLAALEQTVPIDAFKAIVTKIQEGSRKKAIEYFERISPKSNSLKFIEDSNITEPSGMARWVPVAGRNIKEGEVLFEESPDSMVNLNETHCDHCFKKLPSSPIQCSHCSGGKYCSDQCLRDAFPASHIFFCRLHEKGEKAIKSLQENSKQNKNSLGLFMVKYVSMLLHEELKGNGAANMGPFANFDRLPQAYRSPSNSDKKEAKLIRSVFTGKNENLSEFLTDDIFAAMRCTLEKHVFVFGDSSPSPSLNSSNELFGRVIKDDEFKAIGLYHKSAHLNHSCNPNIIVKRLADDATIQIIAKTNINEGDRLAMSFIPVNGMNVSERQKILKQRFDITCACDHCIAGL